MSDYFTTPVPLMIGPPARECEVCGRIESSWAWLTVSLQRDDPIAAAVQELYGRLTFTVCLICILEKLKVKKKMETNAGNQENQSPTP